VAKEIRARFSKGKIEPLEELDLQEGAEIIILVKEAPSVERTVKALRASAGAWKDLIDGEELKRNIYADRLINTRPEPRL
jgi:predicted DNA-binding antitoxin AbrB/MazE fold protein